MVIFIFNIKFLKLTIKLAQNFGGIKILQIGTQKHFGRE